MSYPTYPVFIAFLDANPTRYKNNPEADGYNPTDEIITEITDQKQIANPDPQGNVLKPLTVSDLQAILSEDSLGRLSDTWWDNMRIYLNPAATVDGAPATRDDAIATVLNAESRGNITTEESASLQIELQDQIPDPTWPATVADDADCTKEWDLYGFASSYVNEALGR